MHIANNSSAKDQAQKSLPHQQVSNAARIDVRLSCEAAMQRCLNVDAAEKADVFDELAVQLRPHAPDLSEQAAKVAHLLREAEIAHATFRVLLRL